MANNKLKICFAGAEVDPFVKTGGLADVMRALPLALHELGHDVRIFMPAHHIQNFDSLNPEVVLGKHFVTMGDSNINFVVKKIMLDGKIPVYLIENYGYFAKRTSIYGYVDDSQRYAFFDKAILKVCELLEWAPNIIHSNDWHTGLIPYYLVTDFKESATFKESVSVYTIHNLGFQGVRDQHVIEEERDRGGALPEFNSPAFNTVNFMMRGILYADAVTTVSETYAREITTPKFGAGLDQVLKRKQPKLFGIPHGVDYDIYNPETDKIIPVQYNSKHFSKKAQNKLAIQREFKLTEGERIPMLGLAHRMSAQKGFSLIAEVAESLLKRDVQIFAVGSGAEKYMKLFQRLMEKYPKKVAAHLRFDRAIAHKVYAASDIFLMPSSFEPGGISQLLALRYGSVPVVRATGGLADTVSDYNPETQEGNGFVFTEFNPYEFYGALSRALETYRYQKIWKKLAIRGMEQEFSWVAIARRYTELYQREIATKQTLRP